MLSTANSNHYLWIIPTTLLIALLSFFEHSKASTNESPEVRHVVFISIDGFRSEFYQQDDLPAPMLQQMARDGVQADGVKGVFPSLTYPSHTSLITGSTPSNHGIFNNTPFEPKGQTGIWNFFYDDITTPTLWDLVNEAGGTTVNVGWPVTVGAPIDYNVVISGALQNSDLADDPIRDLSTPEGLFSELEAEATGKLDVSFDLSNSNLSKENHVSAMMSYLFKKHKPELSTVVLQVTDSFQHSYGRKHDKVSRAIASADRAVSRLVEAADQAGVLEHTAFVISGDHGFTNISLRVAPNVWLVEEGLMEDANDRGDWKATFHTGGGTAFLHLKDPEDTETADRVRELIHNLPASTRKLFRIVERDELDELGATPDVPFALAASPIAGFSGVRSGNAIRKATGGTHGHLSEIPNMETGFVAWGAGISESVHLSRINMVDIAPLIARILDVEFENTDGMLIPGILK